MTLPPISRRVSIVLPAYNEEANIVEAVERATAVADRLCEEHEIVVVDDGSRDKTAELVLQLCDADPRIRLIRNARNRGYGDAVRTGLRSARLDLVFFTDADNQFDINQLDLLLDRIDRAHVVAGYRIKRQDSLSRRITARVWNQVVRALFYVPVRDIDCAFKLFRRDVFDTIDIESMGAMVNTELMVKLGRSGAGVVEVGVTHLPRTAGQARGATPRVVGRALFELALMYRRLRDTSAPAPPME